MSDDDTMFSFAGGGAIDELEINGIPAAFYDDRGLLVNSSAPHSTRHGDIVGGRRAAQAQRPPLTQPMPWLQQQASPAWPPTGAQDSASYTGSWTEDAAWSPVDNRGRGQRQNPRQPNYVASDQSIANSTPNYYTPGVSYAAAVGAPQNGPQGRLGMYGEQTALRPTPGPRDVQTLLQPRSTSIQPSMVSFSPTASRGPRPSAPTPWQSAATSSGTLLQPPVATSQASHFPSTSPQHSYATVAAQRPTSPWHQHPPGLQRQEAWMPSNWPSPQESSEVRGASLRGVHHDIWTPQEPPVNATPPQAYPQSMDAFQNNQGMRCNAGVNDGSGIAAASLVSRADDAPWVAGSRTTNPTINPAHLMASSTGSRSIGRSQSDAQSYTSSQLVCDYETCKTRGHPFESAAALRSHKRCHVPKRHACQHCGRLFGDSKDARRHERTHSPNLFFCTVEICEYHTKGFSRKDNFVRHLKVHGIITPPTTRSGERSMDASSWRSRQE